jgi:hypothetical protein
VGSPWRYLSRQGCPRKDSQRRISIQITKPPVKSVFQAKGTGSGWHRTACPQEWLRFRVSLGGKQIPREYHGQLAAWEDHAG